MGKVSDGHKVRNCTLILIGVVLSSVVVGGVMLLTYLYELIGK